MHHWDSIRRDLMRSVSSPSAAAAFPALRAKCPAAADFAAVDDLLRFLGDPRTDRDRKDAIYADLLRAFRARGASTDLALSLIWAGLLPGLDHLVRVRLRLSPASADELVSRVAEAFSELVASLDLNRVERVAATLVRSTARRVREAEADERTWADQHAPFPEENNLPSSAIRAPASFVRAGRGIGAGRDAELRALRDALRSVVPEDADLVLLVAVEGCAFDEAAEELGLTFHAARKRYQRALERIRRFSRRLLSQIDLENRVCPMYRSEPDERRPPEESTP